MSLRIDRIGLYLCVDRDIAETTGEHGERKLPLVRRAGKQQTFQVLA